MTNKHFPEFSDYLKYKLKLLKSYNLQVTVRKRISKLKKKIVKKLRILFIKMYLAESVSKGGTCNTGADDDDVGAGVGAINVAELSVGEAVVVDTLLWRVLLL